jgi:hypothetical protein
MVLRRGEMLTVGSYYADSKESGYLMAKSGQNKGPLRHSWVHVPGCPHLARCTRCDVTRVTVKEGGQYRVDYRDGVELWLTAPPCKGKQFDQMDLFD